MNVSFIDLQKNYAEIAEEERHDIIPEFWEGHNIADYIDPEIFSKLEDLERDEELRDEAGTYAVPKMELDSTMREIRELAVQIRNKRAIMKGESRLVKQSTKPTMPRNTMARAKDRSVSKLVGEMEQLGKSHHSSPCVCLIADDGDPHFNSPDESGSSITYGVQWNTDVLDALISVSILT